MSHGVSHAHIPLQPWFWIGKAVWDRQQEALAAKAAPAPAPAPAAAPAAAPAPVPAPAKAELAPLHARAPAMLPERRPMVRTPEQRTAARVADRQRMAEQLRAASRGEKLELPENRGMTIRLDDLKTEIHALAAAHAAQKESLADAGGLAGIVSPLPAVEPVPAKRAEGGVAVPWPPEEKKAGSPPDAASSSVISSDAGKTAPATPAIDFACPHCSGRIAVAEAEINCGVFRHGVYKTGPQAGQAIPPHEARAVCEALALVGAIHGCGRPLRYDPASRMASICDWI